VDKTPNHGVAEGPGSACYQKYLVLEHSYNAPSCESKEFRTQTNALGAVVHS
jgi:hypothetical protein